MRKMQQKPIYKYASIGAKLIFIMRVALLVGPRGQVTMLTLLAKAVAGEAHDSRSSPFPARSSSKCSSSTQTWAHAKVVPRDLFKQAR